MIVFAVDDEAAMLAELHDAIAEAEPGAQIHDFMNARDVLNAIKEDEIKPDVVFSDIELPGTDGMALAAGVKGLAPEAKIIFVTGYSQYAAEAYRRRINGYLLKPVDAGQIREELDYLLEPYKRTPKNCGSDASVSLKCTGRGKRLSLSGNSRKNCSPV